MRKSVIQGGRAPLRQAVYVPALVAIRFNPTLKATDLALRKAGKPAKVAIVAVMGNLIVLANAGTGPSSPSRDASDQGKWLDQAGYFHQRML